VTNSNTILTADVDDWAVEMGTPTALVKAGWKSTTIKPGDEVTIVVHSLRTDEKAGQFVSITLANRQVLTERPPLPNRP